MSLSNATVSVPPLLGVPVLTPTVAALAAPARRLSTTVPAIATPPIVEAEFVRKDLRSISSDIFFCFQK